MRASSAGLHPIVARTDHLLLDFDGPVCAIFAGIPANVIADQLRGALRTEGVTLPESVDSLADPLEVFRTVASADEDVAAIAQRELTRLELKAVRSAKPTKGAYELVTTAHDTGRTVSIVTNNSGAAVKAYLGVHKLTGLIVAVVGRDDHVAARMKPSPYRVRMAVSALGAKEDDCALVGDSPSDVLAGRLAGVAVIGFANKPGKADHLTRADADTVTTQLGDISAALRATPLSALPN